MSNISPVTPTQNNAQQVIAPSDWLPPVILTLFMIWAAQINLLLFHTLAELVAIFIALMSAVVCWHMYRFSRNDFLLYLGSAYFWIAILDLMHTLAYKGMPTFGFETSNPAIQLWIVTRYLEAIALLSAPLFINKKVNLPITFAIYGSISALLFGLIMTGHFPVMHSESQGLEPIKVISEYIIIAMLGLAIAFLLNKRYKLAPRIITLMVASMVMTMAAELSFTLYISANDISNQLGHFFKIFSYWAIYLAIIETSMRHPFETINRETSTYDAIPESIVAVDSNGIIRQANQTAAAMAGISRERLIGQHCHAYFHSPEIKSDQCNACHHINSQQTIAAMEIYNRLHDSWTELTLSPIDPSGSLSGMVHTVRDITQRLIAEQELKESKALIQDIIDNMPGIVFQFTLDADDNPSFTYISAQLAPLFGLSVEAAMADAQTWVNAIHPDDIDTLNTSIMESKHNLSRWDWEGRGINQRNNNTLWIHGSSQPRRHDDGSTVWNGIIRDITDIKQAQQTLRELNTIINHSSSIAFLWRNGPGWPVEYVSENVSQFGYCADDFCNGPITFGDIIHPDDRELIENEINEFSQNNSNELKQQYRILDKAGNTHWTDVQTWVRRDEKGNISHFQGIVLDISGRKEIELELEKQRSNLELRVWERTRELVRARDQALHATKVKSEFLANISHELRTPLNSIIGFTGIIKDGLAGEINAEQKKQLTIVDDSAKHLLSLINDILDLSKVETNKTEVFATLFSPKTLLSDICNMITPLAQDKGLTLDIDLKDCPDSIHTDEAKLKQIILNLTSNAIKFTPHGNIRIRCYQLEKYVYFDVIDTGQGIHETDIKKIFEAFSQADTSTSRTHPGTGLGLTISKQYARLMVGDISVNSIYGKGSHFTLKLPVELEHPETIFGNHNDTQQLSE